jgi:hypothetical protein
MDPDPLEVKELITKMLEECTDPNTLDLVMKILMVE